MAPHLSVRGGFALTVLSLLLCACSTYRVMDNDAYRVLRRDANAQPAERLSQRLIANDPAFRVAAGAAPAAPTPEQMLQALDTQETALRLNGDQAARAVPGNLRQFEIDALRFQLQGQTRSASGNKRADYALPQTEGLIPSIFQGIEDNNDPETARAATGQPVSSLFKSIVDAIAKGTAFETGGLIHHDEFRTIAGVDVFNYRLGGNDSTALGGLGIRGFAGSTVTDENGNTEGDPAVAIGLSLPLGQAGGLTLGYGVAHDTDEWDGGVFIAINIAASSGQK